jgi:Cu+-exporting ATPase
MLNIYMPVALLGMLSNLYGKSLIVKREEYNFKYISKEKPKFGLFCMQDDYDAEQFTKGLVEDYPVTAYKRKTNFASDFIKYTYSYDMADRFSKFAVPIIAGISLVVALISALFYNTSFGMIFPIGFVSIFSMLVSFCSCFSIPVYINSMLFDVSKKYAKREGVLLGYQAVEDFYDTNSMVISSKDIFPKGSIRLSAMKLFSSAKVDETLLYAISLANTVDSILAPTLLEILDGNLDLLCNVENCSYEDGLGICGWIDNKRVLMGNRELMESHNIENLPTKSKEAELVGSKRDCIYISVSGNLSLMLIVEILPSKKITKDLHRIQNNGISIAITSSDFLISVNKLGYLFGIDTESVKIIPSSVFEQAKDYFTDKEQCSTSIVTGNDIGTVASMLISTKRIHTKALIGNVLNAVSCIVGIIIGISFITMGGFRELTSTMILVYNLICCAITLLICNNKRF